MDHGDRCQPLPWRSNVDTLHIYITYYILTSARFLVEGPYGAILHTGDVRAEPWFINSLARNPLLQRFIPHPESTWPPAEGSPIQILEAIYIDTAMLLGMGDMPTKASITTYNGTAGNTVTGRRCLRFDPVDGAVRLIDGLLFEHMDLGL